MAKKSGQIHIGIGGWTFAPWRGVFYPEKLTQAKELSYAASKLTSIEINGTYYGSQKPESFRKWASEVPTVSCSRSRARGSPPTAACWPRPAIPSNGSTIPASRKWATRLGPVLWQFAPTKKFDEADFGAFLELLPRKFDGLALRHVVEVRNDSFCTPAFIALLRKHNIAVVYADHGKYPGDRRHNLRFRLRPSPDRQGYGQDRLPAQGARCVGEAVDFVGTGQRTR